MDDFSLSQLGKILITVGVIALVIGVVLMAGSKYSFFGLGRLPGDIAYQSKNFRFYFPLATSVFVSVILALLFWLISLFTRH